MSDALEPDRLRTLLDVGGFIVSELDLDAVLGHALEAACDLTGAEYAALGVLDPSRTELERFITRGVDEETAKAIGDRPRGRGVLGALIADPKPLRLHRVGDHPASYGFPGGHPPMETFLGVPIFIRGEPWGNLYLAEKPGGREFDNADEEAIIVLARWVGIAVENARLYREIERRSADLERANRGLEATQAVALALGADLELERVLELIVKRGRALVDARTVVILLADGDELVLSASAGHGRRDLKARIPVAGSTSGEAMRRGETTRVDDANELTISANQFGVEDPTTALIVPLAHRGDGLGVLLAFDRGEDASTFTLDDEQILKAFAASAATAVATARGVEQQRLRDALAAAEAERRRWAQELHDETLQALGALRVLLSSARRSHDDEVLQEAAGQALEQIEQEITNLRAIITELRPAALDELGLVAALQALFERHRTINDLDIVEQLDLPPTRETGLDSEREATIYRVVQEALTNVVKHARASTVQVCARVEEGRLALEILDDGEGFDTDDTGKGGFGLTGMRERMAVIGGRVEIESGAGGTAVRATLPLAHMAAADEGRNSSSSPRLSA